MSRAVRVTAVVVVAAVLVAVGRSERDHERQAMLNGIDAVRAAIGSSLTSPGPTDYVDDPGETCLLYGAGGRSYALELCFDRFGRAIEALDRRGATLKVFTVASEPGYARLRVDPAVVSQLVTKVQGDDERRQARLRRRRASG